MKKILVVDDSLSIRNVVSTTLKSAGYDVVMAADGAEADLYMPVMDGIEFITEVRKLDHYKHIPILFLTTESNGEKKEEAKNAGATAWMEKPFDAGRLLNVVHRIFR